MCLGCYNGDMLKEGKYAIMTIHIQTIKQWPQTIKFSYKIQNIKNPNTFIQKCKPDQSHSGYHH